MKDYLEEIDFSVKICDPTHTPPWKKMLKKVKQKKKTYDEKEYAFGIYQILPNPPEKESNHKLHLFNLSELLSK
ncbi:MAG: hypothetical protein KGY50_00425 [Candidatus Thermoplasmatota archaeon]|nr:hypothetical protein [Candidatus Thermoplasmatota archaeon]